MKNLILIAIICHSINLFAADSCISGDPKATNLIDQMSTARKSSKLTSIIYDKFKLGQAKTEGDSSSLPCPNSNCSGGSSSAQRDKILTSPHVIPEAPQVLFKNKCLIESGQFKAGTPEVTCPEGTKAKNQNLCLTENLLEYQNAVLSSFSACMVKSGFRGMDPASLFKLYSLESAFKPQYAYNGGVGLGQLTSIFVEDIHQKHRGLRFLKKIAESGESDCNAAKLIAENDIIKKPSLAKTCSFTSVGDGLERNILYTLIGLENSWDKDVSPKFKTYSETHKNDPRLKEAQDLALLNAYSPGGRVAARAAVERLSGLPPAQFIAAIKNPMPKERGRSLSIYINKMEERQKELSKKLPEPIKSEFQKKGAQACVNLH